MRAKGLSAMVGGERKPPQDNEPAKGGQRNLAHEFDGKPAVPGEYVGKHLIFGTTGNVIVANRTREMRLSGMKRGACGNVS
jgi:hypothetical protein